MRPRHRRCRRPSRTARAWSARPRRSRPVTARNRAERDARRPRVLAGSCGSGPGTTYQPDLAESWTSDETASRGPSTIRDDAVWQDGEPVTVGRRRVHGRAAQEPRRLGRRRPAWADVDGGGARRARPSRSRLGTPDRRRARPRDPAAAPAHLLDGRPVRRPRRRATSPRRRSAAARSRWPSWTTSQRRPRPGAAARWPPIETPARRATRSRPRLAGHARPGAHVARPHAVLRRDGAPLLRRRAPRLAAAFEAGDVDAASGLSARGRRQRSRAPTAWSASRYPTTTLSTVMLNLRPSHHGAARRRGPPALLAAIDRDQAIVRDVLGGDGTARRRAGPADLVGVRRGGRARDRVRPPARRRSRSRPPAGPKSDGALGGAERQGARTSSSSSACPPRPTRGWRRSRRPCATPGRDARLRVTLVEMQAADLARACAAATFTAAVVDIAEGLEPDLYPLLASSQVRAPGRTCGLPGPVAGPAPRGARASPARPEDRIGRMEGAAGRTRDPDADAAARLERRRACSSTGPDGVTPRLISDPGDRYWDVLAWRLAADR